MENTKWAYLTIMGVFGEMTGLGGLVGLDCFRILDT